jgi:hypothetical protein
MANTPWSISLAKVTDKFVWVPLSTSSSGGGSVGATRIGNSSSGGDGANADTGVPGEVKVGGGRKPGGVGDIVGSDVASGVGACVGSGVGSWVGVGGVVAASVGNTEGWVVGVGKSDSNGLGD